LYSINHNQDLHTLEIQDSKRETYAKINLNEGASLQVLTLNNHEVIKDLHPLTYADTYASSILFPFANRIKDGAYSFEGKDFQFEANQKEENNALHGLVYNKTFKVIDETNSETSASVILQYSEVNESKGFPYTYTIQLKYTLTKKDLNLSASVKNTDAKSFPFTLGWHPYFSTSDLYKSTLQFDSSKKLVLGDRNITTGVEDVDAIDVFEVKDKQLDDCYILDSGQTVFKTPDFNLEIKASSKENFLQMYIPPKANTIAIEPTTGVSDSFNNKIGLQVLKPNEMYNLNWSVEIYN
jgi:aldose 1-epimerase